MEKTGGAKKGLWAFVLKHKGWMIAVILLLGGGYWWWHSAHSGTTAVQYVTRVAEKGTIMSSVSASGNVVVDSEANIDPSITGTVENLSVSAGDAVKKGQLLFMIDNDQLDVSLSSATASFQGAENSLASANISKDQARDTYNTRSGTALNKNVLKQKLDLAYEAITVAEQNLATSRLSYQKALADAGKRRVTSPIDGTVNEINIKNGDDLSNISSGSSRVTPMIIGDLSTMKASISVNEVDISNVSIRQKAVITVDALESKTYSGKVEKIDSLGVVSQGVVTYGVTVGFDDIDPALKAGMSLSVSLITGVKQDVIMVPSSAVKTDSQGSYVEVLNSGTTPEAKSVTVGITNGTDTEIVRGISDGDKVVTQTINPSATSSGSTFRLPGIGGGGGATRALRGD